MYKTIAVLTCLNVLISLTTHAAHGQSTEVPQFKLISVERIWDSAPHNAFTDLVRFKDHWYCVFREGQSHVSPVGALRVIRSADGQHWTSAALIRSADSDLRDAKITVTPRNQLMLSGAEAMHDTTHYKHQSLAWFSDDGNQWTDPVEIGDRDFWLWRTTWHQSTAYGFGYETRPDQRSLRLYSSVDGQAWQTLNKNAFAEGYPNETEIVFTEDERAWCLLRRDGTDATAQLGYATKPFRDWTWHDLGVRIGGPAMLQMPDGQLIATVRLYDGRTRTSLCAIDKSSPRLTELLELPSGGDTSYAGMVWHDNQLWVSYYASHEGKSAIYLAVLQVANDHGS